MDLQGYGPTLLEGAGLTLQVALLSLLIALMLGMALALARLSSWAPLRWGAGLYTTVMRGIPDLVLMLLLYYGGQALVNELAWRMGYTQYVDVNAFVAGTLTIGLIFGAYMGETLRGAALAVPAAQMEAARAHGMNAWQSFYRIMLPQLLRHALPGLRNNWLVLLKTTALVSVIGLDDMVRKAALAAGATRMPFTFYLAAAAGFLLFTLVSEALFARLTRHLERSTRPRAG